MRIVPVIDLMGGQVVRGIAGQRETYRPIESGLAAGAAPSDIGRALADAFDVNEIYLADLDAIRGGVPAGDTYRQLLHDGISLWIDAGVGSPQLAERLLRFESDSTNSSASQVSGIIVGLESLDDPAALAAIVERVGSARLIFSLDLQQGQPLACFADWRRLSPIAIACEAYQLGVRRMIVLDLAGVGVGAGVPTLELCQAIRTAQPDVELTSGGGVRGVDDLLALQAAGCSAALVASALHDGRITPDDALRFRS